jgi:hypothetical protein
MLHVHGVRHKNEKPCKQESKKKWKTLNKKPKKEEERNPIVNKKGVPTSENKKKRVTWIGEEKKREELIQMKTKN